MKNLYKTHLVLLSLIFTFITMIGASEQATKPSTKIPLIFSYGFGDNKDHFYKKFGEPLMTPAIATQVQPISFDYSDASVKPREAGWFSFWNVPLSRFWNTSFGQKPATIELLKQLISSYNQGDRAVSFVTHSCGSASAAGLLDLLAQPQKYSAEWQKLGFVTAAGGLDLVRIDALNTMVKRGFLLFIHPLLDIRQSFQTIAQQKLWFLPGFISRRLGAAALYVSSLFNNYNPQAQKPIDTLKELQEKNLLGEYRGLVMLAKPDSIVGNGHDEELKRLSTNSFTVIQELNNGRYSSHFSLSQSEQIIAQNYLNTALQSTKTTLNNLPADQPQLAMPQQEQQGFLSNVTNTIAERPWKIALLTTGAITGGAIFYYFVLPKIRAAYHAVCKKIAGVLA